MNNHINDRRVIRTADARANFLSQCPAVEFDHMPIEVATEMLLAPKARMTNRERKECARAREIRYESARTRKSVAGRLARTYTFSSFSQLNRWHTRAVNRGRDAQCQFQMLAKQLDKLARSEKPDSPIVQYAGALARRRQAELDLAAAHHNLVAELTLGEINSRI